MKNLDSQNISDSKKDFLGCFFPTVLGGLLLFILFLIGSRISQSENRQLASQPEPPLPVAEIPTDIPTIHEVFPNMINYYGTVAPKESAYIVRGDGEIALTVAFAAINSIKGLWNGSNAVFEVRAPYFQSLAASTHTESWDDLILYELDAFNPWLSVSFSVEPQYYHTWIDVSASLDILYPTSDEPVFFYNKSDHLERDFRLFIVTEEDIVLQAEHDRWEQAIENASTGDPILDQWFWPLLMMAIVALLVAGYFYYKIGG